MLRGTKPTPTKLKLIKGGKPTTKHEASFKAARPQPPGHLSATALVEWHRVSRELFEQGMLSRVDRSVLAAYCQAYARWVQAERAIAEMAKRDLLTGGLMIKTSNGNAIQNPLVGTANKAARDMVRYAVEFGMSPSARSRIETKEQVGDPAVNYFA